jgi:hypothetical protein
VQGAGEPDTEPAPFVDLAVGGQRQLLEPLDGGGHHVVRQRRAKPLPQQISLERLSGL